MEVNRIYLAVSKPGTIAINHTSRMIYMSIAVHNDAALIDVWAALLIHTDVGFVDELALYHHLGHTSIGLEKSMLQTFPNHLTCHEAV